MYDYSEEYTLKKHISNIKQLEEILNCFNNETGLNSKTNMINCLADFLQYNEFYIGIKAFDYMVDTTVKLIQHFNLDNSNYCECEVILKELVVAIREFIDYLFEFYKINIYFEGKDKYNLIDKCLNYKNINYKKDYYNEIYNNKNHFNILLISEDTSNLDNINKNYDEILYYDEFINDMFYNVNQIYFNNYDYNYLLNSMEMCKNPDVEMIIVGNSYPMTGIKEKKLNRNTVKLALSSQDLYYSYKIAKEVIKDNSNIKECIIGLGYYLVNHDLSRGKSDYSTGLVKNTYYPILKDSHNLKVVEKVEMKTLENYIEDDLLGNIFNLNYLQDIFIKLIYQNNDEYFNSINTREKNSALRGKKLSEFTEEEKVQIGEFRANQHNDLKKHNQTKIEYEKILNEFLNFLNSKNIKTTILILPTTKYYSKYLNKDYKKQFYEVVGNIKKNLDFEIIDLYESDILNEDNFIDVDHINESGAIKITNYLNEKYLY